MPRFSAKRTGNSCNWSGGWSLICNCRSISSPCPCVRAEDGLALSSRNQRLSPQARSRAAALPQALFAATRRIEAGEPVADVLRAARADLAAAGFDPVEYLELRDATTLGDPVAGRPARLLVAAMLDGIRLIDNTAVTLRT